MRSMSGLALAIGSLVSLGITGAYASGRREPAEPVEFETVPDRLSVVKGDPHYSPVYKRIGVNFDGERRENDVEAYDRIAGWIDVRQVDKTTGKYRLQPNGRCVIERLCGKVEPFFATEARRVHSAPIVAHDDQAALSAAEAKRARKAAKLVQRGL